MKKKDYTIELLLFCLLLAVLGSCTKSTEYIQRPTCYRYIEIVKHWDGEMSPMKTDTIYPSGKYATILCNDDTLMENEQLPRVGCPSLGYWQVSYALIRPDNNRNKAIPTEEIGLKKQPNTEYYIRFIANSCYPESVQMSGDIVNNVSNYTRNGVKYRVMETNFYNVIGLGMTSGRTYTGTGSSKDILQFFPDGSTSESVIYFLSYSTKEGDSIVIQNKNKYNYSPTGEQTIEYNIVNHKCK